MRLRSSKLLSAFAGAGWFVPLPEASVRAAAAVDDDDDVLLLLLFPVFCFFASS